MPLVQCGPSQNCVGVNSPTGNLSAEGPDVPKCFRHAFTEESSFTCEFDLSLCDAYAALGIDIGIFCNPPDSIINGTNPPLPIVYSSNAQTCTDSCGQTYTVVAGTFVATTQAQADAQAFQFACTLAAMLCLGPLPTIYTNTEQSCSVLCPDGSTFTFTAPAGISSALSQAQANADAYAFACAMASLLCSGLPPVATQEDAGVPRQQPASPLWANTAQACSANCPGGGTSTYVIPGGTYLAESRTAANNIALSAACRLAQLQQACLSGLPSSACKDEFFAEFLSATGLMAPVTYTLASGSFPPGISLDSNGLVSGVPSTSGSYSFAIRATGTDGTYTQRTYGLNVVEISPGSLPAGTSGQPYAAALSIVGMNNPTWSVIGGLPASLTLHPVTGVISGTISAPAGDYPFTIIASDGTSSCSKAYSINVSGGSCPDWTQLLWGVPAVFQGDPFSSSYAFLPAQNTAADTCQTTGASNNLAALLSFQWDAFITINTAADCNCSLATFFDNQDFTVGASGNVVGATIAVVRMDTLTQLVSSPTYHQPADNGGYAYPFTLPAGNYQVRVRVDWSIQDFTAIGFLNLTVNAGVSNV